MKIVGSLSNPTGGADASGAARCKRKDTRRGGGCGWKENWNEGSDCVLWAKRWERRIRVSALCRGRSLENLEASEKA